jgi:hypothetical protein
MDEIIQSLIDGDVKQKMVAIQHIQSFIEKKTIIIQHDLKLKLISNCISTLKDANPKVVLMGFDVLQKIIENQGDFFQPFIQMTFDAILNKFCDSKVIIRNRSTEFMVLLINLIGLSSGFEKLNVC